MYCEHCFLAFFFVKEKNEERNGSRANTASLTFNYTSHNVEHRNESRSPHSCLECNLFVFIYVNSRMEET
jgi:hypothetical protein